MDLADALTYAVGLVEAAAANRWTYAGLVGVAGLYAFSYLLGEDGLPLRKSMVHALVVVSIGGLCALVFITDKKARAPDDVAAAPQKTAEQKLDEWLARRREHAARTPSRPPPTEMRPGDVAVEVSRWRDLAAERRELQRRHRDIDTVPERERTPQARRDEASALRGLARIDRDDGRLDTSIASYRSAMAVFRRIGDLDSRRAVVQATLDMADALDARGRERDAREAYRRAIAEQRELPGEAEPDRRTGVAGALLRYARFEVGRRKDEPARSALDEADDHYEFLRARRGKVAVMRARTERAILAGKLEEAQHLIAAMRALAEKSDSRGDDGEIDFVAARLEMADQRPDLAVVLFERAAASFQRAGEGLEDRRGRARALLGSAEAAFDLNDTARGRERLAAALLLYRATGDRAQAVDALARLSLWEVAAGDLAAGERALADAVALQRESGEARPAAHTESIIALLCMGVLQHAASCRGAKPD